MKILSNIYNVFSYLLSLQYNQSKKKKNLSKRTQVNLNEHLCEKACCQLICESTPADLEQFAWHILSGVMCLCCEL